jgi:hypothetical protein
MKYKTIVDCNNERLDEKVNHHLAAGWHIHGSQGVVIEHERMSFVQAMVLPDPADQEAVPVEIVGQAAESVAFQNAIEHAKVPVIRGHMWEPKRPPGVIERWRRDGPRGYRFEATNESFDDYEIKDGGLYASGVRKGPADQMQFRVPEDWQRIPKWCRWAEETE